MPLRDEILADLLATLPPLDANEIDQQARAILRVLLEPISTNTFDPILENPSTCPNCDAPCALTRSPYCSAECREVAGFVRQLRAGLADGSIVEPDRQIAFGQNLWQLLGGGLPLRVHLVPPKVVTQVIAKNGEKCTLCDAAAVTVDHIGTACNRPINLRAVCLACSKTKPFGDSAVLAKPAATSLLDQFTTRIGSPSPIRCCDHAATWDWRAYLVRRHTSGQA